MKPKPCSECRAERPWQSISYIRATCQRRKTLEGAERTCIDCNASFMQEHFRHRRCHLCYERRQAQVVADRKRPWKDTLKPCKKCGVEFQPTYYNQRFCVPAHRKSAPQRSRYGQAGTFFIHGRTAAEFAFETIMRRKGIRLRFIGANGTRFALNGTHYRPDFYDKKQKIYYEVSGTRQAYHANKAKYALFRQTYPALTLNIVRPDGTPITVET